MTLRKAVDIATKNARETGEDWFVIYSEEDYDFGGPYHACNEEELDTFFEGCEPIEFFPGSE